jgi:hypothetical protein
MCCLTQLILYVRHKISIMCHLSVSKFVSVLRLQNHWTCFNDKLVKRRKSQSSVIDTCCCSRVNKKVGCLVLTNLVSLVPSIDRQLGMAWVFTFEHVRACSLRMFSWVAKTNTQIGYYLLHICSVCWIFGYIVFIPKK